MPFRRTTRFRSGVEPTGLTGCRAGLTRRSTLAGAAAACLGLITGPGLVLAASGSGGTRRRRGKRKIVGADLTDLDILARTVWAESRGESFAGQMAVAFTVIERARQARAYREETNSKKHALYGDGTVGSACLMPWQFSCWNEKDPNRAKLFHAHKDAAWESCLLAAETALAGAAPNNNGSATHYCATMLRPTWTRNQKPTVIIGRHKFYRLTD